MGESLAAVIAGAAGNYQQRAPHVRESPQHSPVPPGAARELLQVLVLQRGDTRNSITVFFTVSRSGWCVVCRIGTFHRNLHGRLHFRLAHRNALGLLRGGNVPVGTQSSQHGGPWPSVAAAGAPPVLVLALPPQGTVYVDSRRFTGADARILERLLCRLQFLPETGACTGGEAGQAFLHIVRLRLFHRGTGSGSGSGSPGAGACSASPSSEGPHPGGERDPLIDLRGKSCAILGKTSSWS